MSVSETPGYFAFIPANVRYCKELEPNAKLLYGEITALTHKEGYCWASNKYFADLYGVSERSITNWLQSLEKEEFIEIETYKNGMKWERRICIIQKMFTKGKNFPDRTEKNFQIERKKISTDIIHKSNSTLEEQQQRAYARDPSPPIVSKPAAVSFSENKAKQAPPKKWYPCLDEVQIEPSEKLWITEHHSEDTVKNAIEWVRNDKQPIKTTYVQKLKWACEKGLKIEIRPIPKKTRADYEMENRSFWTQLSKIIWKNGLRNEFREGSNYVEAGHSKVYYTDVSFLEQIENTLRKFNFCDLNIYKIITDYRMSLTT